MAGRRKFSREFKVEAVQMIRDGGLGVLEVAKDLGIRPDVLRRWKRQVETRGSERFPGAGGWSRRMRRCGGCAGSCSGCGKSGTS